MKRLLAGMAALALAACVSVTVDEEIVRDETPDCEGPRVMNAGQITSAPVAAQPLANAPGKTLTAVRLNVPPGARSNPHQHAGTVFVYVLKGAVCSQITGDAGLKPYKAGDSFFEPPGSHHVGFTNPGLVTAEVLVTFIADTGATLTGPVQ
jgi:quercetin dioxygenase-like cupin family protein